MVHEVILNSTLVGAGRAVSHDPSSKHLCHLQQLIPLISSYVIGKEAFSLQRNHGINKAGLQGECVQIHFIDSDSEFLIYLVFCLNMCSHGNYRLFAQCWGACYSFS